MNRGGDKLPEQIKISCAKPLAFKLETKREEKKTNKEVKNMILIGRKAPDFTAPAYHKGNFVNVKLSDYQGRWVVLCFYPGDFTFV